MNNYQGEILLIHHTGDNNLSCQMNIPSVGVRDCINTNYTTQFIKIKMGNRHKGRQTEAWELDAISNIVGIPRDQLDNIYRDFRRVSKDYLLDKYEFRHIYKDLIRYSSNSLDTSDLTIYDLNRRNNATADRIFKAFDQNKTGRLDFDEFISAYVMLQNSISPQTRLNFLLDHYSQEDGYITPNMGRRVIQDMSDLYGVNTDYQQVWRNLETNYALNNGRIPQQAFTDYFINHPAYAAAFYKGVQAPLPLPPPSPQL
jgi:Ca2+-binding EF-hand superfamily protein